MLTNKAGSPQVFSPTGAYDFQGQVFHKSVAQVLLSPHSVPDVKPVMSTLFFRVSLLWGKPR